MKDFFAHLFLPQSSNNHRAKVLHHSSLLFFLLLLSVLNVSFFTFRQQPGVLGTATSISPAKLFELTNQMRQENNVAPLSYSNSLAKAAEAKAQDMFSHDYWDHFCPCGNTPWMFIKQAGYNYAYAGENLARGFTSSQDVIAAWMASPEHRQNMLSKNYMDIGFAVEDGVLTGEQTTLVVEMFGSPADLPSSPQQVFLPIKPSTSVTPILSVVPTVVLDNKENTSGKVNQERPAINRSTVDDLSFSKAFDIATVIVMISLLILDAYIIEKKKIIRLIDNHLDHVFYLGIILLFILLFAKGVVI